jgi:hypothetical protein
MGCTSYTFAGLDRWSTHGKSRREVLVWNDRPMHPLVPHGDFVMPLSPLYRGKSGYPAWLDPRCVHSGGSVVGSGRVHPVAGH